MFSAHAGLVNYLLSLPFLDERIADAVCLQRPGAMHAAVPDSVLEEAAARIRSAANSTPPRLVLVESSSTLSVRAFALALCERWQCRLAVLDLRCIARDALRDAVVRAHLFAWLNECPLLLEGAEALQESDGRLAGEASVLRLFSRIGGLPVVIHTPQSLPLSAIFSATGQMHISLPMLDTKPRRALWQAALHTRG